MNLIPPAGGYPPFYKFLLSISGANLCLEKLFEQEVLLPVSSGKSALFALFSALRQLHGSSKVVVSSYSCPDIVTALVRAGYKAELAPISQKTLEIDRDYLLSLKSSEYAAIIFSNLYGMRDSIPTGIDPGILVVDDLCQSLLSKKTRVPGISIFSASRGKSLCGLGGGGLILTKGNDLAIKVFDSASREISTWSKPDFTRELKVLLIAMLIPTLEQPKMFALLNTLAPFLKLGEVVIDFDFKNKKMSSLENLYAAYQYRAANLSKCLWPQKLAALRLTQPYLERKLTEDTHLIRYPILLKTEEQRLKAIKILKPFGLSPSYGKSLFEFEELKPHVLSSEQVKAIKGLVTLPTHKNVSHQVMDKITEILSKIQDNKL